MRPAVVRLLAAGAILAIVGVASPGRAQDDGLDDGRTTHQIEPPRLKTDSPAGYPDQARRDRVAETVTVVLVLDVDATGRVMASSVAEARGHGFDEAALAASRGLAFEPATRDGHAIAARVKFRYTFPPPLPGTSNAASPTTSASGPQGLPTATGSAHGSAQGASGGQASSVTNAGQAPPPHPTPPEEATVHGERPPRDVTKRTLSHEELDRSPGSEGDALLSLLNLPGVARPPPLTGLLSVRGSAPEDTNIYVDGTNIPIAYHFGGLAAVVPTELLDKIDFYPGNFSAQYGRGMGGVVDIGLRDPKADRLHAFAQNDVADVRLMAEGPIFKTGWNFLLAARRTNPLLDLVLDSTSSGFTTAPRYYDYQAILQRDLNDHSSFRLLFLGSDDALKLLNAPPDAADPTLGGALSSHTDFLRVQARYENRVDAATTVRARAAFGRDATSVALGVNEVESTTYPLSLRAEVARKIVPGWTANVGVDLVEEPYRLDLDLPAPLRPGQPSGGPLGTNVVSHESGSLFLPGAYAELEITPWRGMRIVPGLRVDDDSATKKWDVAPRINVRQDLATGLRPTILKAGIGLYDQPPQPFETAPNFGQLGLASNRSLQIDAGFEQPITRQLGLSVDGFYKRFQDLVVAGSGNSGSGFAYGTEWFLRYAPDAHFFGWISYTISRSERRDLSSGPLYPFAFDQTHVLTVVASVKPGRGWQLGARFRLVTGNPYTPTTGGAFDATAGSQIGVSPYPPDGSRLPVFRQLDVRVDKTWTIRRLKINFYVDVQNVTDAQNVEGVAYNFNYTKSTRLTGIPILPVLGVRAEF